MEESVISSDKMLLRPLVYSRSEMVTLGLPILVTILLLLCVLLVLILIIRKRTEPKIPDLSSDVSKSGHHPLLEFEDPLFKSSSRITKELFYPPMGEVNGSLDRGLFMDIVGNNSVSNKNNNINHKKKVPNHELDWLSPSSSEWLSINDYDLYSTKNYDYQDARDSQDLLPVTSMVRSSYQSPIRDSPRDELLFFRREDGRSNKEMMRKWTTGEQELEPRTVEVDDVTRRRGKNLELDEEHRTMEEHFIYNSPQPERIPLPSSSFISATSSLSSYNHAEYSTRSSNLSMPSYQQHHYGYNHNPFLGYNHHLGSSIDGGMSCCDLPAPRVFDPTIHPACLCTLNHFPGGGS